MKPSRALWEAMQDLLAADTGTLGAVAAMHVHLAAAAFTPSLDLALGTLTEATFNGSAAKNAGTGTQQVFYDQESGARQIQLLEPAGGWTWECAVTPGSPETIYGYYVTDNADAVLLGAALLGSPLTISAAGQGLTIPRVTLSFLLTSPF